MAKAQGQDHTTALFVGNLLSLAQYMWENMFLPQKLLFSCYNCYYHYKLVRDHVDLVCSSLFQLQHVLHQLPSLRKSDHFTGTHLSPPTLPPSSVPTKCFEQ